MAVLEEWSRGNIVFTENASSVRSAISTEGIRPVGRSVRERVREPFTNRSANAASYGRYFCLATLLRADLAVAPTLQ